MSRRFVKNTSNYMAFTAGAFSSLVNGLPRFSANMWIFPYSFDVGSGNANTLFSGCIDSGGVGFNGILLGDGTNVAFRYAARSVGTDTAATGLSLRRPKIGIWQSVGMSWDFVIKEMKTYIDGVLDNCAISTTWANSAYTVGTPTSLDNLGWSGTASPNTTQNMFDGLISHFGVWGSDIGADNFARLAMGKKPNEIGIKPLAWMPLYGIASPETDLIGSLSGTITGTLLGDREPPYYAGDDD